MSTRKEMTVHNQLINLKSLVYQHNNAGYKFHTQYGYSGKPKCVKKCLGRVNFTCCCHAPTKELKVCKTYNHISEVKSGVCNTEVIF